MKTLTAAVILAALAILGLIPANAADAPQPAPQPPARLVATTSTTTTTTPFEPAREALEASDGESCPGWVEVARQVGWPEAELPMVGAVTYFESRCLLDVRGDRAESWTAFQLHTKSWCRPTRYYPDGYLQSLRIVETCEDLLDPATAARAALAIWEYGGWEQWSTWRQASTTLGQ
jgi:hypothetical protein